MKITMLGCGPSAGVPLIGGRWGACDPSNPKNRRTRPSVLVESAGVAVLIDTSPDLRAQLLAAGIGRIDAVLFTHDHADHVHGIDDLRTVYRNRQRQPMDAYADPATLAALRRRFGYLFEGEAPPEALYRPILVPHEINGPFTVGPHRIVPFEQDHGICMSLGFRIGRFAYSTDVVEFNERAFAALDGVELWIVDCLRAGEAHPTHAHLDKTLGWIRRVRPRRAIFTHMNHEADFDALAKLCPPGVEPGYDGLVAEIEG
jgi:phosphoribosyl 1,2-cyclic phosphate phosphodiesterase